MTGGGFGLENGHEYHRDLSHTTWPKVFERQALRRPQTDKVLAALDLKNGDTVVDIGCGPGYNSLLMAEKVGREGHVYAVDPAAEALEYLAEQIEAGAAVDNITLIHADGRDLPNLLDEPVQKGLLTYVLHHDDDPAGLVMALADGVFTAGGLLAVCEYDPEAPGEVGPPLSERLSPQQVLTWLSNAGFAFVEKLDLADEQYGFILMTP